MGTEAQCASEGESIDGVCILYLPFFITFCGQKKDGKELKKKMG